jgi:hypothetical protein
MMLCLGLKYVGPLQKVNLKRSGHAIVLSFVYVAERDFRLTLNCHCGNFIFYNVVFIVHL